MRSFALFSLVLFLATAAHAQSNDEVRRVVLTTGEVYVGVVQDETADPVVVTTRDGIQRQFRRDQVSVVAPLIRGRFFRTDPVKTSLIIAPTARTQGTGNIRLGFTGFVPSVTAGVSDRVDVTGAGFLVLGSGASSVVPLIGVKGQVLRSETATVALGLSAAAVLDDGSRVYYDIDPNGNPIYREEDNSGVLAVPYGVATFGDETQSATLGVAGLIGSYNGEIDAANSVVVWAGGERQLNNGVKLLLEGLTVIGEGDSGVLLLPGVRLFGNRFALDIIGFLAIYDGGTSFDGTSGLRAEGFAPLPIRLSYTF